MRRISILALFIIITITHSQLTSNSTEDDWRNSHHHLNGTRFTLANVPSNISTANVTIRTFSTGTVYTNPTIANGTLFINVYNDRVYLLNASNINQSFGNISQSAIITASPISTTDYQNLYLGDLNSILRQYNLSNLSHQIASNNFAVGGVYGSVVVDNNYVYSGSLNAARIYQFNASNISQTINSYSTGSRCEASPVLRNGYVYAQCNGGVYQLNATNVSIKIGSYTVSATSSDNYANPISDEYFYVGAYSGQFYQFNATNISYLIANYSTGYTGYKGVGLGNGFVYGGTYGSGNYYFYQFNASNVSRLIAQYNLSGTPTAPVVTPNYVFVGGGSKLYQFDAQNISNLLATYTLNTNAIGVSAAGGFVYVTTSNRLYQFGDSNPLSADSTPPTITINNPTNTTYNTSSLNFNVSISEAGSVNLSIDLGATNYSMTNSESNDFNYTLNNITEGSYTVNFYAVDAYGNNNSASRGFTIDLSPPEITIEQPQEGGNYTELALNYTLIDQISGISNCTYSLDGESEVGIPACNNITINTSLGNHTLVLIVNDSAGNTNQTNRTFTIVDLSSPQITINQPLNTTYNSTTIQFNISLNEAGYANFSLDDSVNYTMENLSGNIFNYSKTNISEGRHTFRAYTIDIWGNVNNTDNVTFTVDSLGPQITILNPINGSRVGSLNLTFNAADQTSQVDSCWYSLDGGSNTTIPSCNNLSINSSAGNHTIQLYSNDTNGNINSSNSDFEITDFDLDGIIDDLDFAEGTNESVLISGITNLNITVSGNSTNGTFDGLQEILFLESDQLILNFTHNFSSSELNFSRMRIILTSNSILVNLSGQVLEEFNKTIYLEDRNYTQLCLKNQEIESISEISGSCSGTNELDFSSCINGSQTQNGISCLDEGSRFIFSNVGYSAIRGSNAQEQENTVDDSKKSKKRMSLEYRYSCTTKELSLESDTSEVEIRVYAQNGEILLNQTNQSGITTIEITEGIHTLNARKRNYVSINSELKLVCNTTSQIEQQIYQEISNQIESSDEFLADSITEEVETREINNTQKNQSMQGKIQPLETENKEKTNDQIFLFVLGGVALASILAAIYKLMKSKKQDFRNPPQEKIIKYQKNNKNRGAKN